MMFAAKDVLYAALTAAAVALVVWIPTEFGYALATATGTFVAALVAPMARRRAGRRASGG